MSIYNLKCDGDQYRITKFDNELNVESSYLCTESECECPAGHRSTCRHRQMLPIMLNNRLQDTSGFYDFDNKQVLVPICNEDAPQADESGLEIEGEDEDEIGKQIEAYAQADEQSYADLIASGGLFPELTDPVSSNGKTADFDSANAGSNPATGAIHPTIGKINRRI